MDEKIWSKSWISFWFFTCWGALLLPYTFVVIGTWNDLDRQRALLDNHIVVPTIVQQVRFVEKTRSSDQICLDVAALTPNPYGLNFSYCASHYHYEDVKVGDQVSYLVSPDGRRIGRAGPDGLAAVVASNGAWQPIVRLGYLWVVVFHLWRFVPALFARKGRAGWVLIDRVEIWSSGPGQGGPYLRVYWHDPTTSRSGRTRDIYRKDHMPNEATLKKQKAIRMYRAPITGRLWWEAELPGFKGELTPFPGSEAMGWAKT